MAASAAATRVVSTAAITTTPDARIRRIVSESPCSPIKRGAYAASGLMVSRHEPAPDRLPLCDLPDLGRNWARHQDWG